MPAAFIGSDGPTVARGVETLGAPDETLAVTSNRGTPTDTFDVLGHGIP